MDNRICLGASSLGPRLSPTSLELAPACLQQDHTVEVRYLEILDQTLPALAQSSRDRFENDCNLGHCLFEVMINSHDSVITKR